MDAGQHTTGTKALDFDILQAAIAELEARAVSKPIADVRKQDNVPIQNRLVKLIGSKPIFQCKLSGVDSDVLWDTGSQIAMTEQTWLANNFPDAEIGPITDFLSEGEKVPKFTAANNTEVEVVGCTVLNFQIGRFSVPVPFLVTESPLSHPIIGFNVFKHLIEENADNANEIVDLLVRACDKLDESRGKVLVNMISKDFDDDDFLGDLKATKPTVIPPNGSVRIRCRVKGDVKGLDLSFICSEPCISDWDDELVVTESLGELARGRTPHVNIEIRNCSSVEKFIRKNQIVGEICAIKAVHPIKLFNSAPTVDEAGVLKVETETDATEPTEKWQPKAKLDHLPEHERIEIEQLLYEECEVFAKSDTDIGDIRDFQMDIHLTDEIPVNQAYRHLPRKLYDDVKDYLSDLIVNGWIQESSSPYASPIVCVRKKDGTLRLCVDYRKLNLKTIPDRQPIPRVQDLLDGLHGQKYFSTLDMAKAYHQGYVRDICRKYTAFSTPWALFEWLRIPFGLKNAPAAFQKFINQALSGLLDKICLAYLDDILIYGKTFQEHKQNLRRVLKRLKAKGVKLRVEKCDFVKPEVRYLGRLVSGEGYRADPIDVKALDKFRVAPKSVGDVRSLLGFLGYYRNYVRDFAKILKPVYDLLKIDSGASDGKKKSYDKHKTVNWSSDLQERVDTVITTLQSPTVMAFPDFESPFILTTDASAVGLGAVLYQKQGDEKLNRVISYASRTLSPAEKNYYLHSGKLEFLALKWAVTDKFPDYLGHGSKFTVLTDNNPLTYVMTSAKLNATGMRWVTELAGYDFELRYRPGKDNADADGLSRNPLECASLETLERECTDGCDHSVLSSVLSPSVSTCTVSANLLDIPDPSAFLSSPVPTAELQKAQIDDDVVGPVYQSVSTSVRPNRRAWQMLPSRSKLLFRQLKKLAIVDGILVRNADHKQIVLPARYHPMVYTELHQKMGHLGSDRVYDLARRRFFWPHMPADIEFFCQQKCSCIASKAPNVKERAPLVPIHATRPFEMVSIDFVKLDLCKGGFQHLLVVVDHFTRFAQAYPTKRATSRAAADALFNNFILQFGYPARIHHDLGREFNSNLFKHMHEITGIDMSNTTAYHPEGDGQCERLNRTVINMLKSIPENEKDNWKLHIPKLMFAYNSTINKTTLFSPFFLLFGREPRFPIDSVFPDVSSASVPKPDDHQDKFGVFAKEWNEKMSTAFNIANKNIDKNSQYHKQYYDRKSRCVDISVGDRVLVKNLRPQGTTRAAKLASYWDPIPYIVLKKLDNAPVYVLERFGEGDGGKTRVLHRNHLKLVNPLHPVFSDTPASDPAAAGGVDRPNEDPAAAEAAVQLPPIGEDVIGAAVVNPPLTPRRRRRRRRKSQSSLHSDSSDSTDDVVLVVHPTRPARRRRRNRHRVHRPVNVETNAEEVESEESSAPSTHPATPPRRLSPVATSPPLSPTSSIFHSALSEQLSDTEDVDAPPVRPQRQRKQPDRLRYDRPGVPFGER